MDQSKIIYLASDRQNHTLKEQLKQIFQSQNIKYLDIGLFNGDTAEFSQIKLELEEKIKEEDGVGLLLFGKESLQPQKK